ncbi:MAG: nucleobase:cation symporter-2 family protein, partial [Peptostreptococcaceae bacterium]
MSVISCGNTDVFEENVSKGKLLILAFQHVLTMCPASIAVPLILGSALNLDNQTVTFLVSANLFTSGISVLIQTLGVFNIGSKLPLVMGASFAPLGVMISIGGQYGLDTMFGAVIGSGILIFIISFFMEKILVFFPNVVIGSFVTLIGISLIPVAFKDLAGGEGAVNYGAIENIMLGGLVLVIIILLNQYGKGLVRSLSLLIGIIVGTAIAFILGMVDMSPVMDANWFEVINPTKFGMPKFRVDAILMMTIFCVINLIQCIGVYSVLDEVCQTSTDTTTKIKGLRGVAMGQVFAGLFCSVPSTMFNENVGLIELTNVKSRSVIKIAGIFLIAIGFFPKIAALITIVPKPVMGGATISLFGIILTAGISILSKVDFSTGGNFTIIGISLAVGIGVTVVPNIFDGFPELLSMLLSNGLFMVSITAIILNILFNFK